MKIDISCVLALHAEGLVAHKTIRAINRAAAYAATGSLTTEFVVMLDKATTETRDYVEKSSIIDQSTYIVSVDFGDVSLTRNLGVEKAHGEYVAILDGDDLVSENWLLAAYKLNWQDRRFVIHPEVSLYFDQKTVLFYHPDQRRGDFDESNLILENYWTALCFSRRETFLTTPYRPTPESSGFGYEDWHWNCEVMARGFVHTVAPFTAHFIRSKETGSRNTTSELRNAVMRHSALFDELPERGVLVDAAHRD